ncbi:hypothetical protein FRC02_005769 [Tulasnella sp. 418]|nr:hypothetical protein FRC02_005769 [Tulasnella sp. 418]
MIFRLAVRSTTSPLDRARGRTFRLPLIRHSHSVADQSEWPPFLRPIIKDKASAVKDYERILETEDILLFCDGSRSPKGVGAACVDLNGKTLRGLYIGPHEQHTALEAELVAIKLSIECLGSVRETRPTQIFSDSTLAISVISGTKGPALTPGEAFALESIRATLPLLTRQAGYGINLRWLPGHDDLKCNESAHRAAQLAAISMNNE